jgi:hypothetical protein
VQNIAYASAAYLQEIREKFIRVSDDEVNTVLKEESIYHDEKNNNNTYFPTPGN